MLSIYAYDTINDNTLPMEHTIFQFAIIIIFTTIVSIIGRQLKLPLILAYLLTGILLSFMHVGEGPIHNFLEIISTLGVAFLLFMIGIELKISEIRTVGIASVIIGLGQILVMAPVFYIVAGMLGFSSIESVVLAITLTFSSTIIVVKLLSVLGDTNSLYGRISLSVLLVQDLVAVLAKVILVIFIADAAIPSSALGTLAVSTFIKFGVLIGVAYIFVFAGKYIFGYLAKISHQQESTELFLLGTISWVLAFTYVAEQFGLSLEIGAFLAGISLSGTGFSYEIAAKIRPLRDFFITLFFILLGSQVSFPAIADNLTEIGVFSLLVIIATPLSIQIIMRLLGYGQRTNILTGLALGQVGEFSMIVAAGAYASGLVGEDIISLVTIVAVITITVSSYLIMHGEAVYARIKRPLGFLTRPRRHRERRREALQKEWEGHVILIGVGRIGEYIQKVVEEYNLPLLIIDYDPFLVNRLSERTNSLWHKLMRKGKDTKDPQKKQKTLVIYGDIGDTNLFDEVYLDKAKLVISTIGHFEDNVVLVEEIHRRSASLPVWVLADSAQEVETLEKMGVDTVIWRHEVLRDFISDSLKQQLKKHVRTSPSKKK